MRLSLCAFVRQDRVQTNITELTDGAAGHSWLKENVWRRAECGAKASPRSYRVSLERLQLKPLKRGGGEGEDVFVC